MLHPRYAGNLPQINPDVRQDVIASGLDTTIFTSISSGGQLSIGDIVETIAANRVTEVRPTNDELVQHKFRPGDVMPISMRTAVLILTRGVISLDRWNTQDCWIKVRPGELMVESSAGRVEVVGISFNIEYRDTLIPTAFDRALEYGGGLDAAIRFAEMDIQMGVGAGHKATLTYRLPPAAKPKPPK